MDKEIIKVLKECKEHVNFALKHNGNVALEYYRRMHLKDLKKKLNEVSTALESQSEIKFADETITESQNHEISQSRGTHV